MKYYVDSTPTEQNQKFRIVPRDEWGAVDPLWVQFVILPIEYIFFEYTNTKECHDLKSCANGLRLLQSFNLNLKDNPDIRYK